MESLGVASVAGDLKGTAAAMVDMELGVRVRVFGENGEGAGEGRERGRSRGPYPPQGSEREGAASTRWSAAWRQ